VQDPTAVVMGPGLHAWKLEIIDDRVDIPPLCVKLQLAEDAAGHCVLESDSWPDEQDVVHIGEIRREHEKEVRDVQAYVCAGGSSDHMHHSTGKAALTSSTTDRSI
jgi:hypothetical protein